nr:NAD-dependent DNA ligase LigA [bacterium]
IDGVVVSCNEIKFYSRLGIVGKAPRYMVAYKFPAEQSTTKLLNIEVQVGRTGALTPVAILEPVNLAGTVVSRATLHNYDEIVRKDVRVGDTVIVQKAGDIIPEVLQSLPSLRKGDEKKFVMPDHCPICASPVSRDKNGKIFRCENKYCYAQIKRSISHFVSKPAFNIDGLGQKIVEQLINKGLINDVADIFGLTIGDLEPLERFAEKSAENLVEAVINSKVITLDKFIYALGIRHVGTQTAFDLAKRFGKLDNFLQASREQLDQIDGIGEVVSESVFDFLQDKNKRELIFRLLDAGVKCTSIESSGVLDGKLLIVTGTLEKYSRESVKELIKKNGGRVVGSISKNIDWVVVGKDPGTKARKAEEIGLKIINESELEKLLLE